MKQPNYKTNCSANSGSTTINCEISDSDEEQCLIHEDEEDMDEEYHHLRVRAVAYGLIE